jgi:NhaC family Na+:H+ antiporter
VRGRRPDHRFASGRAASADRLGGHHLAHAKRELGPTNLSRLCADSGTVTSPLVPWNSCGAFMGATLGVSTLLYLPFCFFNILSPLLSVLYGLTGFKIVKTEPQQEEENVP